MTNEKCSVVDLDSLNPVPDPAFQVNPDPGVDDQKLKKKNTAHIFFLYIFSDLKFQFTYHLASLKDVQGTGEAFSPQNRT